MLFFEDEDQEWWGESRQERMRRMHADHYDGEMAAKRLFSLAVLWLLSGILLVSAITALVSATLFLVVAQLLQPQTKPDYADTYLASFKGTLLLLCCSGVLALITLLLMPPALRSPVTDGIQQLLGTAEGVKDTTPMWLWLALLAVPGIAAYAAVMSRRMAGPFAGTEGFALSFCTAIPSLAMGIGLPVVIVHTIVHQVRDNPSGLRHMALSVVVAGISLFVYSVLGALLSGLWLWVHTRMLDHRAAGLSYGRAYTAALLTLPVHSLATAFSWIALTQDNPFRAGLWPVPHGGALLRLLSEQSVAELANIAIRLLVSQVPGFLLGAAIVTVRLRGPYLGAHGYARAVYATALSMCLTGGVATTLLAITGF